MMLLSIEPDGVVPIYQQIRDRIRVPRERAGAPVISRERRAYYRRTAAIGVCCVLAAASGLCSTTSWLTRSLSAS
jgi:hypothetical protein